ncbi:transcriptional regulator [Streptomyces kanamyceticus]|uniref:Transcriptional regulator n=2 Tax=Streptomyces kanamyceticus TaxID=1967 RepID=A0A5J6GTD4_STRKN|nr:transcriptional regulator [Streptomyces kanamyceticus]
MYLTRLRRRTSRSQRQLAADLCALSGVQSVTRNEISRWERGERLPGVWLPFLASALKTPLADLEQAAAYARGDALAPLPGPAATLAELLPPDDPLAPLTARSGRRIGMTTVDSLAGRVHGLRLADDVLSGGDLAGPAVRELRAAVKIHRESSYDDDTGRALLVQIGELAQICGWILSDAGRHADAEHAYGIGISAARQAGDTTLVGNVAGSLAYQHANNGREREGVDLARAALEEAGPDAPPKTRALFLDRVAWTLTKVDEAQPAMRALEEAHAALSDANDRAAPTWSYWVSREELEIMDARVFTELKRPLRAVPLLTDVLGRYEATHARELALYRSWLSIAYADANEPEAAAEEARAVIELSGDLASDRTAERTRVILRRLQAYEDVPEARAVLDDHGHLLLV